VAEIGHRNFTGRKVSASGMPAGHGSRSSIPIGVVRRMSQQAVADRTGPASGSRSSTGQLLIEAPGIIHGLIEA